jgi:hypothetical protein
MEKNNKKTQHTDKVIKTFLGDVSERNGEDGHREENEKLSGRGQHEPFVSKSKLFVC